MEIDGYGPLTLYYLEIVSLKSLICFFPVSYNFINFLFGILWVGEKGKVPIEEEDVKPQMHGIGRRNEELNQGMDFRPSLSMLLLFHIIKHTQRQVKVPLSLPSLVSLHHATPSTLHCPPNRHHCLLHHLAHKLQAPPFHF
ncbi:hypothetical protein RIF29_18047 [Crotalaria pallida]|uniref:Uncharacterized protein n=1 Tax=Crotalaria pallida TaxID=3830 RepID=A0AAN9FID5_CROPI